MFSKLIETEIMDFSGSSDYANSQIRIVIQFLIFHVFCVPSALQEF